MNTLNTGSTLKNGAYKIIRTLGQGSFGITYLASARTTIAGALGKMDVEVNIAIKEFFMSDLNSRSADGTSVEKTDSTLVKNYRTKFRREAENLSKLHHTNIVKVLDVFDENNTTYYVMEYVDGMNLDDYIKQQGRLTVSESLRITKEVCSALSYMHEHKMLHLDLKPKNIMRDRDGHIRLIDFGLSKQYNDSGEPESSTTIGLGTPGYAPTEQANYKQDGTLPVTIDVYALGGTLYKMLTGQTPPEASYILNEGLPEDVLSQAGVPEEVIAIVDKAMEPKRKLRYQSVEALSAAIVNPQSSGSAVSNLQDEQTIISPALPKKDAEETVLGDIEVAVWNDPDDRVFTVNGNGKTVTFRMKKVEAGAFWMGSDSGDKDEKPVHLVTLTNDYYIGETEVTQALWFAVMGQTPLSEALQWTYVCGLGDDYPAYYITYEDCIQFITKLNQITGQNFRLPTEAEWEFAAKGGNLSRGNVYAGSNDIDTVAWYSLNSTFATHAVGQKHPNELGLYDMSGNVWEWCNDWYGDYSEEVQKDPVGPTQGTYRVYRGGSFGSSNRNCRPTIRMEGEPTYRYRYLGLRLAL